MHTLAMGHRAACVLSLRCCWLVLSKLITLELHNIG